MTRPLPRPPPVPRLTARARTDPALTLAKLPDVFSPHCGIVTGIERFDVRERAMRGVAGYATTLEAATPMGYARFRELRGTRTEIFRTGADGRGGSRVAFDPMRAFVRAVGEALERYACCTYDPGALVTAAWRDVREHALDPRACQQPSAEEYARLSALTPFREDAPMRWQWAWRLGDGAPRLVPAQMCYVMYNLLPGEPRMAGPTSTGWAIHHTREEAVHSALREIVERDSFMLTWLHRLRVPTLDLDSVDMPDVRRYLASLREGGGKVRVLVTTTDLGIPSFALAAHDPRPGRPAFLLTLAAHPDPRRGLRQAVEEAAMMRLDLTARLRAGLDDPPARMEEVEEMADHAEYYLDPAHLAPVRWLLDETDPVRLDALDDLGSPDVWVETQRMVARIAQAGMETLYVDTTPPDLREAGGWHAAKVIVPGSVRHEYGHLVRYLDCPRILDAPLRMGLRSRRATPDELNSDVHPYS
jgi:ribosomal protein S12 methylthiotransferase accessory factor